MKRWFALLIVGVATLAVPSIASAHSGTVTCTSAGVIFHYNANFPSTTTVTQTVNGVSNNVIVNANTAVNYTVALPGVANVTASATRNGGISVVPVTQLTCPVPAPPAPPVVVTPPAVTPTAVEPTCLDGTSKVSFLNGILTCEKVVTNTVTTPPTTVVKTVVKTKTKYKTRPLRKFKAPPCPVGKKVKVIHQFVICVQQVVPPVHRKLPGVAG